MTNRRHRGGSLTGSMRVWAVTTWMLVCVAVSHGQYEPTIADVDSVRTPQTAYVGAQACAECHDDAYQIWLGTPHARSWVFLATPMARMVAEQFEGGPVSEPTRSARCLDCHATAARVDPAYISTDFHFEEGVQCEACHGPGADHAQDPQVPTLGSELAARSVDGTTCSICHRPPPSHSILERESFNRLKGLRRIAHGPSMDGAAERLKPRSRFGRVLRSLLGR